MEKQDAVAEFEETWRVCLRSNPHLVGDYYAQLEAWIVYVGVVREAGLVTDLQAFEWISPVRRKHDKTQQKTGEKA